MSSPGPSSPPRADPRALAWGVTMPALRWDGSAYRPHDPTAPPERCVREGVAGFILFGGEGDAAARLIDSLRAGARRPLLFGADLERGVGQQFAGSTSLPPAGALGALDDLTVTRAAGEITGREAGALGIDLLFAPVADLAGEPDNPIVGPRAFAADAAHAARHVAAWIEGARGADALPCVKHFPGHGRAAGDTHLGAVTLRGCRRELEADLEPFRAAIAAGVPLVMPGHLAAPALDPTGAIATVSPRLLGELLRGRLGFEGVIVSDALLMGGAGELTTTAVEAIRAGVDLLLYPAEADAAVEAVAAAARADAAFHDRLAEAWRRVRACAERRVATRAS
ncbi:MAG: glycoside hydrolase family 3 N-terminal domain-containing protein, partial [Longimicrobiales bacterium]|nr:glycoside hydrolase family 3 N-terminal domain-containing protein [Longimicrobiales bacterium]